MYFFSDIPPKVNKNNPVISLVNGYTFNFDDNKYVTFPPILNCSLVVSLNNMS